MPKIRKLSPTSYKSYKRIYERNYKDSTFSVKSETKMKLAKELIDKRDEAREITPKKSEEFTNYDNIIKTGKRNKKLNKDLDARTNNNRNINVFELMAMDLDKEDSTIKSHLDKVKKILNNFKNNNTKNSNTNAIAKIFTLQSKTRRLTQEEEELHNKLKEISRLTKGKRKATTYEGKTLKDAVILDQIKPMTQKEYDEWEDYDKIIDNYVLKNDKLTDIQDAILGLYLLLPVERYDFRKLELIDSKSKGKKGIDLQSFKTSKKYPSTLFDLSDVLVETLDHYITQKKIKVGDPLFKGLNTGTTAKFTRQFNNAMEKIVGKTISPRLLRKIYITNFWSKPNTEQEILDFSNLVEEGVIDL
eukprot:Awhi_evm4s7873